MSYIVSTSADPFSRGQNHSGWLMLLPDGRCVPVTDDVAAGWGGPRTLIEIGA